MGKKKGSENSGKTAGRSSWVKGSKLTFFEARKQEFLDSQEAGGSAPGNFYHKMARMFFIRWGWALPPKEDGPVLEEPSEGCAVGPVDWGDVDDNERARRRKTYEDLRNVSFSPDNITLSLT